MRHPSPPVTALHLAEDLIRTVAHGLDASPYKSDRTLAHDLYLHLNRLEWFTSCLEVISDPTINPPAARRPART